ncbi:DUF397 domain-containing protein [Nocardiopsis gilva YIM 90087]|uniref:DUF397 domain-containing protein n=1 Tax=Nocardiopsis gilva YIM 90087 TaxID=1235441 RepID=A0A223SCX5_9ACTN|nr:DUF397 domain-containing protein [Nocardiopsis gilva]ASU81390.1 DUF397 domain-containing protein [Nocardiopsis gilva YIM 90087]ASU85936.1 DUF397 domain-containing protein [Nocardiopsis gilva YIM 90087]
MSETNPRLLFHKSSYSANSANCVEVAATQNGAAVRDSKQPHHGHLLFATAEWRAFIDDVKAGSM